MVQKFTDEKGSITIFVLASCLFFLVSIMGVEVYTKNKQMAVDEKYHQIKSTYEKDLENKEKIYNDLITTNKNENIEVTFETREKYLIPTNATGVTISQKFTIKDGTNYSIEKVKYGWSNTQSSEPTEWKELPERTLSEIVKKSDVASGSYYLWVKVVDENSNEKSYVDINSIDVIKEEILITKLDSKTVQIIYPEIENIYNKKIGIGENEQEAKNNAVYDIEEQVEVDSGKNIYVEATDSYGNKVYKSMSIE